MYTLFLVDDEWTVREGLQRTVPWERAGCRVVGTAADGLTALAMLEERRPDILLTDIRMPGLDGIELARRAVEKLASVKVIMLTGFDEFDYARAAIDIGAVGYVMKPTDVDELLEVVGKAVAQIAAERQQAASVAQLQTRLQQTVPLAVEKVLQDMMFCPGSGNPAVLAELLGENPDAVFTSFQVLRIHWEPEGQGAIRRNGRPAHAGARERHLEILRHLVVPPSSDGRRWWIPLRDGEAAAVTCVPLTPDDAAAMEEQLRQMVSAGIPIAAGVSQVHSGVSSLPTAASEAETALDQKDVVGQGRLIQFSQLGHMGGIEKEALAAIIAYLANNFHLEISLRDLAVRHHVSESHLSRIFKEFTGLNFSDYVARLRIRKAQRLLEVPGARVHEVAHAVGYRDARYFSQVFRRQTGLTPTEYRDKKGG